MLPHLLEVAEGRPELFQECTGATKSRSLQLLSAVERVSVLEEPHIVICNAISDRLGFVAVAEGQFVVVTIVEHVH